MKRVFVLLFAAMIILSSAAVSTATNGDNLISIGPIARAMGGVGIAAPQDAISAVFANPAAMCFGPYCPGSEANLATTVFLPKAKTRITAPALGVNEKETSDANLFIIPALGISTPITQQLRFGFAAYGVSGLGVDYRNKLDLNGGAPGAPDVYTNLSILKIAPNLAYMVTPNLSIGGALHIDYGSLDLGDKKRSGFGVGAQLGAIYKTGPVSFGIVYVSPQRITHHDVADLDMDGFNDDLTLESPQTLGFGVAYEPIDKVLLIEANAKWINWSNAEGYSDFGWRDQWVFSLGTQYRPTPSLALRAGVNHGKNPVKDFDGWDAFGGTKNVQGKDVLRYMYEVLRVTGFPALVETHVTAGLGYRINKSWSVDLGYTHAFRKSMSETGTAFGTPVTVKSSLSEDSIDFGLTYRF